MSAPVGSRPGGSVRSTPVRGLWANAVDGPTATATASRTGMRVRGFIDRLPLWLLALGRRAERLEAHGGLDAVLEMRLEFRGAGEAGVLLEGSRIVSEG